MESIQIKNVLIADDHYLTMKGISDMLKEKFIVDDILMFANPSEVVDAVAKQHYELYILDLEFEDSSGFDLIQKIRAQQPDARIIVCTMHEEIWNINKLLTYQVNGIILKRSMSACFEEALKAVMEGEEYMCPRFTLLKTKVPQYRKSLKTQNSQPTVKERIVVKHMSDGYTSKEIAVMLEISENAIEGHRKSLFGKLEARNAAHLIAIAIKRGLIDPD